MRVYTYPPAPNPFRLALFLAEKGLEPPVEVVNIRRGEQFAPAFRARNPNCDVPVLELEDGTWISQLPAIFYYLERRFPAPSLYGPDDVAAARSVMWEHLAASNGLAAVAEVLRNSSPAMANRALVGPHDYPQIPALVERGRRRIRNFFADLDARLSECHYVAGDHFGIADITAWVTVDFATWVHEHPAEEQRALRRWHAALAERPAFRRALEARSAFTPPG
ncbi:MAG: glutathione S-transferase [Porticoccaceae bacterium]|nr:MAG: glutathione S-transferase [Porticoccaceae bacterium]